VIWRRLDTWCQVGSDPHYRVAAFRNGGALVYQAFFIKDRSTSRLKTSKSAAECREAAETHKKENEKCLKKP
jgi:hypothetical protein